LESADGIGALQRAWEEARVLWSATLRLRCVALESAGGRGRGAIRTRRMRAGRDLESADGIGALQRAWEEARVLWSATLRLRCVALESAGGREPDWVWIRLDRGRTVAATRRP